MRNNRQTHAKRRGRDFSERISRIVMVGLVGAALVLLNAGPASAHEGEEGTEAFLFVRQAVALIVNTPNDHEAIADKINDAVEAPDDHGVDVALVGQAQTALEAEDIHQTRTLLEQSIGAAPHLDAADPAGVGDHVEDQPEEDAAVEPFLDPFDTSTPLSGSDWTVLGAAGVLAAAGLAAATALRPTKIMETTR